MKKRRLTTIIVALLPAFLVLSIIWGAGSAQDKQNAAPAAIVNEDEIATLPTGGQLPGGRQIIAALTDPENSADNLDWNVVSASTAQAGLKDGTYNAVVTIPKEFSTTLVDIVTGKTSTPPQIKVEVSDSAQDLTGRIATVLTHSAAQEFGTTLTVNFLQESLGGLTEMSNKLGQAADGAAEIAAGQSQAADGAAQLSTGLTQANSGAAQLTDGAAQLHSGLEQLNQGTHQLATGNSELASGISAANTGGTSLNNGLKEYISGVKQLHSGIVTPQAGQNYSLKDGASQLSTGVSQYVDGVAQVHSGITVPQPGAEMSLQQGARAVADGTAQMAAAIEALNPQNLQTIFEKLKAIPENLPANSTELTAQLVTLLQACAQGEQNSCSKALALTQELGAMLVQASQITAEDIAKLQTAAQTLPALIQQSNQISALATGADQVADGIDTLASEINTNLLGANGQQLKLGAAGISSGINQLADGSGLLASNGDKLLAGSAQLSSGLTALESGAQKLAAGSSQLSAGVISAADGAAQLAPGAAKLSTGIGTLAQGASQLETGLSELGAGTSELATGLETAVKQIPTYTEDESQALAKAIGSPIDVNENLPEVNSYTQWAATALALALWLGALAWVISFGVADPQREEKPLSPAALMIRILWPASITGVIGALLAISTLKLAGVSLASPAQLIFLALIAAIAFVAIHQA
ncbi:MAG: hypothetical protein SPG61_04690, partial [Arcanobacterium sp.]|nr:hypothetical protein [Arcanobacterium sp.]